MKKITTFLIFCIVVTYQSLAASEKSMKVEGVDTSLETQFLQDKEGAFAQDIEDICAQELDWFQCIEKKGYHASGYGLRDGSGMPHSPLLFLAALYKKERYFFHLFDYMRERSVLEQAVNQTAANGDTALQAAVFQGNKKMVVALINAGAQSGVKNAQGRSLLDIAQQEYNRAVQKHDNIGKAKYQRIQTLLKNYEFIKKVNSAYKQDPSIKFAVAADFISTSPQKSPPSTDKHMAAPKKSPVQSNAHNTNTTSLRRKRKLKF